VSGGRALAGRRVLITGAARGIGALTAEQLHRRGARVALLGIEPELLAAVAERCGGAAWFHCDVSDRAQVKRAVEEIFKVKVLKVNTTRLPGKVKRLGRFEGRRPDRKKAVVQLAEGDRIEIFEGL